MDHEMKVKLLGSDGQSMPDACLRSLYSSDLHFEPMRRRSEVRADGMIMIETPAKEAALHARVRVPDFGDE